MFYMGKLQRITNLKRNLKEVREAVENLKDSYLLDFEDKKTMNEISEELKKIIQKLAKDEDETTILAGKMARGESIKIRKPWPK